MSIFIVTFGIDGKSRRYMELLMTIHRSPGWAKINDFAYFVKTDESAVELRDRLEYSLTDEDTIFVAKFDGVAAWRRLHDEVSDWLKENYKEDDKQTASPVLLG